MVYLFLVWNVFSQHLVLLQEEEIECVCGAGEFRVFPHLELEVHRKDFFLIIVFVLLDIRPILGFHPWADCTFIQHVQ